MFIHVAGIAWTLSLKIWFGFRFFFVCFRKIPKLPKFVTINTGLFQNDVTRVVFAGDSISIAMEIKDHQKRGKKKKRNWQWSLRFCCEWFFFLSFWLFFTHNYVSFLLLLSNQNWKEQILQLHPNEKAHTHQLKY